MANEAPDRVEGGPAKDVRQNDQSLHGDGGEDFDLDRTRSVGLRQMRRVKGMSEDQLTADDRQPCDDEEEPDGQTARGDQKERPGAEPRGHPQGTEDIVDPVAHRLPPLSAGAGRLGQDCPSRATVQSSR